ELADAQRAGRVRSGADDENVERKGGVRDGVGEGDGLAERRGVLDVWERIADDAELGAARRAGREAERQHIHPGGELDAVVLGGSVGADGDVGEGGDAL